MRTAHLSSALALAAALAMLAPSTRAQAQPAASSAETKLHFQRAVKLYAEEDCRGALVDFKRAYELSNNLRGPVLVAVLGIGVGTTFGILALGTKSDLDARCPDRVCPADARDKGDALSTQTTISTIGLGVGVLDAVLSTYFLVTGGSSAQASTRAAIAPYVSGAGGGLQGRF